MVIQVTQIPALFLPKRGADEKHPMKKTPVPKQKQQQSRSLYGSEKKNRDGGALTSR